MPTYKELLQQRDVLEEKIAAARKAELVDLIPHLQALIIEYRLNHSDLYPKRQPERKASGAKGVVKYRDEITGLTWNGLGRAPTWIAGQDREPFAV